MEDGLQIDLMNKDLSCKVTDPSRSLSKNHNTYINIALKLFHWESANAVVHFNKIEVYQV